MEHHWRYIYIPVPPRTQGQLIIITSGHVSHHQIHSSLLSETPRLREANVRKMEDKDQCHKQVCNSHLNSLTGGGGETKGNSGQCLKKGFREAICKIAQHHLLKHT